jgi:ribose transport system substrate-binding protein
MKPDLIHLPIERRTFIRRTAKLAALSTFCSIVPGKGRAANPPTLVTAIRDVSNPYHTTWNQGGQAFAKAVGGEYVTLLNEGNSEKGIADIEAIVTKTGGNVVLNIEPNDQPDARPIADICSKAGAYFTTQWNKPTDKHPWDFDPYYVAHISFDGIQYGEETGKALIKAMGGSGGIVALGGILSNTPAIERKAGLEKAIAANPGVKLLDFQAANWKSSEAYTVVGAWLTRFGSEIKGIWAANDDMAIGALEALRSEKLAGKIPITGIDGIKAAVDAIRAKEFAATVSWDPFWQGGMGLAIAYGAKTGKFDPAKEPHLHREFYGAATVVTQENVEDFYKTHIESLPSLDWSDLWGRVSAPVREG